MGGEKTNLFRLSNTSDFTIKPIVSESPEAKNHSSKRLALSEPQWVWVFVPIEEGENLTLILLWFWVLPIQDNKLALPVADPLVGSIGLQPGIEK